MSLKTHLWFCLLAMPQAKNQEGVSMSLKTHPWCSLLASAPGVVGADSKNL
jgi:hypothetical protein